MSNNNSQIQTTSSVGFVFAEIDKGRISGWEDEDITETG